MKKERIILGVFLATVGILTIFDIIEDSFEGASFKHLSLEIAMAMTSFLGLIYLCIRYLKEKNNSQKLAMEKEILKEIAHQHAQKSKAFIEGLSLQIDHDFNKWGLSEAERDVALFLLKGLGPKQISEIRTSSEKTVRHQINSIYKKAGIHCREELSAYFLEDLLGPTSDA